MRSLFPPIPRSTRLILSCLALSLMICTGVASATDGVESRTGYAVSQYQAAPAGETLVSFDWDSTGALYYTTGLPNYALGLTVYRSTGGNTAAVYQSPTGVSRLEDYRSGNACLLQ